MQAIILKKIPIKERDELIVCYTKEFGKATFIARGILNSHSKQATHLDVLNLVDFSLVQRKDSAHGTVGIGTPIITSAYSLNNFINLKQSLPALAAAHFILEVFDKFVFEEDPDDKLWQFINAKLAFFNSTSQAIYDWPIILEETRKEILETLGFSGDVDLEDIIQLRLNSLLFTAKVLKSA